MSKSFSIKHLINREFPPGPNRDLKIWIWVYIFLWVFEGALRKWFLPFLATPLLLVRDPIVLWLIFLCMRRGMLKYNNYLAGMTTLGIVGFFSALFFCHGNFVVAIYGIRPFFIYFPMLFIIGRVFDRDDVVKVGKLFLYIAIPMSLLIGLQFYSPQSALVNRGVGGDEAGSGFGGAMGYFRPSATFSFTNGTTLFYSLVAPFLLYFTMNTKLLKRYVLIGAAIALAIAIPLSISRGLLFQVVISILFLLISVSSKPKYLSKIIMAGFILVIALNLASNVSVVKTATEVFTSRFESANEEEGGLVDGVIEDRFLGQLFKAIGKATEQSLFGYGIGSGTIFGAVKLDDYRVFGLADFEWMRQIGEFGLMGLFVVVIRVGLTVKLSLRSYIILNKGDLLPWLLASVGALIVIQGSWQQPTALGFFSLVAGLWIASMKTRSVENNHPAIED